MVQSNKEQVRAHSFVARRLTTAVVTGQPDAWETPLRRSSVGTVIGIVLALLLALGFAVYGLLRPGTGPKLHAETTVVVEKETGTRYVVDGGRLRPVPNLASALLAVGPDLAVQTLSARRTAMLPRGEPLGVDGAPSDVPAAGRLATSWSVCVAATTATASPATAVAAGPDVAFGGAAATPLDAGEGLLVSGPDDDLHLVVGGVRHAVVSEAARTALGYAAEQPVRVPAAWLAGLVPGRPLQPLVMEDAGADGPVVGGLPRKVGQVLVVHTPLTAPQYFVVQRTGVTPVTSLEQRLLSVGLTLAKIEAADEVPMTIPEAAVVGAVRREIPAARGWPADPPPLHRSSGQDVCVGGGQDGTRWTATRATRARAAQVGTGVRVTVPPGSGALVETVDSANGARGLVSFVDDLGRRFPLAGSETLTALGFEDAPPLPVPVGVLAAVPPGPLLDVGALRGPDRPDPGAVGG